MSLVLKLKSWAKCILVEDTFFQNRMLKLKPQFKKISSCSKHLSAALTTQALTENIYIYICDLFKNAMSTWMLYKGNLEKTLQLSDSPVIWQKWLILSWGEFRRKCLKAERGHIAVLQAECKRRWLKCG